MLKPVSAEKVMIDLVVARAGYPVADYFTVVHQIEKLSNEEKMVAAKSDDFPLTWKELFEDGQTQWFETELPPTTEFVNKIFDPKPGHGFQRHIGLKHSELVAEYVNQQTKPKHAQVMDTVRKKLVPYPRIIVLTRDFTEYVIFDGAHRAVAFTVEKKNIPVFIGKRDSFTSLPYF